MTSKIETLKRQIQFTKDELIRLKDKPKLLAMTQASLRDYESALKDEKAKKTNDKDDSD